MRVEGGLIAGIKKTNEWLEERYGADGCIDWSLGGKSLLQGAKAVIEESKEVRVEEVVKPVVKKGGDAEDDFDDAEAEAAMAEAFEAETKKVEVVKVEEIKPAEKVD